MSTRAIYSFKDERELHHVYKHHDGYPSGAAGFIANALSLAWPLPRFEADEFAASFVAANKGSAGGVRLLHSGDWKDVAPGDVEYRYHINVQGSRLHVAAYAVHQDYKTGVWTEKLLFAGKLDDFARFADKAA